MTIGEAIVYYFFFTHYASYLCTKIIDISFLLSPRDYSDLTICFIMIYVFSKKREKLFTVVIR